MATEEELRAVGQWLRTRRANNARLRDLRKSFEIEEQRLKERVAEAEITWRDIYRRTGPVTTVYGSIGKPDTWDVKVNEETLLEWAKEHRPGVVKETVTQKALTESGAKWKNGALILESGEFVEGIWRVRSDRAKITHTVLGEDIEGEDDE